ncbi:MAG: hypothetical protein R3E45_02730 [Rhodocyclaceae bacterium]
MRHVRDIDALLLLATTLASKRRPAELVEIIAAFDFLQTEIGPELRLREAFAHLSEDGLILERDGGYTLGPEAQKIMAAVPKKGDLAAKIFSIKDDLSTHTTEAPQPAIVIGEAQLAEAMAAHKDAGSGAGKNLLMPKPKPAADDKKRPAAWRPFGMRRRTR